eukprot:89789_1
MAAKQAFNLQNKVAIVTGASGGIGRAITTIFSQQNAKVIGIDIDEPGLKSLENEFAIDTYNADVSDKQQVKSYMDDIFKKYGKINILCNNAGSVYDYETEGFHPFHLRKLDGMANTMNVNLWGSIYNCYYGIHHMLRTINNCRDVNDDSCSIINMSSVAGDVGASMLGDYSISKFALDGLTRAICADYTASGIRCNSVKPGFIDTPLVRGIDDYFETITGVKGYKEMAKDRVPSQKVFGDPEDVANLCLYLASDESKFVSGALMRVDGGTTAAWNYTPNMIPEKEY